MCNFLDQLLHPYKFHGRDMSGILFFIFASCEPLSFAKMAYSPSMIEAYEKRDHVDPV